MHYTGSRTLAAGTFVYALRPVASGCHTHISFTSVELPETAAMRGAGRMPVTQLLSLCFAIGRVQHSPQAFQSLLAHVASADIAAFEAHANQGLTPQPI